MLAGLLLRFLEAPTLGERLDGWMELSGWSCRKAARPWARMEFFLAVLARQPELRRSLQRVIGEIFAETEGVNAFAEAGLPTHRGMVVEFWDRLIRRTLPAPRDDHDLGRFLARQFHIDRGADRFRHIPIAIFHRLIDLLFTTEYARINRGLRPAFADGFRLLAAKIEAQGLSADIRERMAGDSVAASPFYRLRTVSEELAAGWFAGDDFSGPVAGWRRQAEACREALDKIQEKLTTGGVSVEIVYGIAVVEQCLGRMEAMIAVMALPPGPDRSAAIHALFSRLVAAVRNQSSLRYLLSSNMNLLHRRIVERSGSIGQHYIAFTRKEYWGIWLAAAGGGLVTTFTMAIKLRVTHLHIPLFWIGFLAGLNYAVSFVILQACGFVLATKQPAMTAARLAGIVREKQGEERKEEIAAFFAQITSSQLAAALGNVLVVSAGAVAFNALWWLALGRKFLTDASADEAMRALSPLNSGTVFFAALTGVLLWLASLMGGWIDNFSAYHRLPQAIRDHRLRDALGRERMERWAAFFEHNIAGWGTNVSLGFLLGMTPILGTVLGIPLEVRHVTLSTGQLAIAASSTQEHWWYQGWFLRAFLGIGVMFVLNLSVSFLLSLFTAARAYGLKPSEVLALLQEIGRRFVRKPRDFLLAPPKEGVAGGDSTPSH